MSINIFHNPHKFYHLSLQEYILKNERNLNADEMRESFQKDEIWEIELSSQKIEDNFLISSSNLAKCIEKMP